MTLEIGKKIWAILNQVMHQQEYAAIAENFRKSTDELQLLAQSFSQEQWEAFENYRDSLMDLNEAMMAIALEKE